MAHNAVTSKTPMGRKPSKPKKGQPFRMHIVLPAEIVDAVDALVEQMRKDDPLRSDVTRTYAIARLLADALKTKGLLK